MDNAAPYEWIDLVMISMGYMFDSILASTDTDTETSKIIFPAERRLLNMVDPQTQAGLYALAKSAFETAN